MLNGWTGFLFGSKLEQKVKDDESTEVDVKDATFEDDWVLIENQTNKAESLTDDCSGRSSPVFVPEPNVMEMSTFDHVLHTTDVQNTHRTVHRQHAPVLATGRFTVAEVMGVVEKKVTKKAGPKSQTQGQMTRANQAVKLQAGGGKAKQRKNRQRNPSGYNNDRKCQ